MPLCLSDETICLRIASDGSHSILFHLFAIFTSSNSSAKILPDNILLSTIHYVLYNSAKNSIL